MIGALLWRTTVARADVAQPVSVLARYSSKRVTKPRVSAAKKVLKCLLGTLEEGPSYSPESERRFDEIYGELLDTAENGAGGKDASRAQAAKKAKFNLFSDASFASCAVTLRSTSGAILYYRGTPILWRTAKQSVRAYSTSEAEYVAASDALVATQAIGFSSFFEPLQSAAGETGAHSDNCPVWVDSQSAISVAKTPEVRPRSRHYALRLHRVRDEHRRIFFVPTHLKKADALTKTALLPSQRELVLHNTRNPPTAPQKQPGSTEDDEPASVFLCRAALPAL